MAGKFGKFGERERKKYLDKLRDGVGKMEAARSVGVSNELIRLYRKDNQGFSEEEAEAAQRADDRVENALFKAALNGNVTACQVWLYNRRSDRWKDLRNLKVSGLEDVLNSLPAELARDIRGHLAGAVPAGRGEVPAGANGVPHAGPNHG